MTIQNTLKPEKPLIFVDNRELNSNICEHLSEYDVIVKTKNLEVADYICSDRVAIEKKSIVSNTPVIIRTDIGTSIKTIEEAEKLFKNKIRFKVMGFDIKRHNMDWFDVYDVTSHKSKNIYGISFSCQKERKNKKERTFSLEITGGHNVYVFRGKRILCLPTRELKSGDYLILIPPKLPEKVPKMYISLKKYLEKVQASSTKGYRLYRDKFRLNSSPHGYNVPKFNNDFFFVLGLFAAEGHLSNGNVIISQKTEKRNKIIESYLKKVFGSFSYANYGCYCCGGKLYYNLFKDMFGKCHAGSKEVPILVFNSPVHLKASFIKGYLFGDGGFNTTERRNSQIKSVSKSKKLLVGLSYIFYSMGIENTMNCIYKTYKKERRKYYEITIRTKSLKYFLKKIGQIPTKRIEFNGTVSTQIPYYSKFCFYKPLLRLSRSDLEDFYAFTKQLKELYDIHFEYFKQLKNIIKKYSSKKEFADKYDINYSTLRNLTNGYARYSSLFLKIVNILRKEESLKLIEIDFIKLKKILNKLKIETELNRIAKNDSNFENISDFSIMNIYEKIEKRIGFDSIFLLIEIYRHKIFLERIRNIEKIPGEHKVYDFSVQDSENFVGGLLPVLLHNTVKDFISSLLDQRIFHQLKNLSESYERPVLLIEGNPELLFAESNVNPNAIRGALASIAIDSKIPVLWTQNSKDTAAFIYWIAYREQVKEKSILSIRSTKKPKTPKQHQEYLVAGLPNINSKLSKVLLKHFKTPRKLFCASLEKLQEVDGIGKKKAERILELLNKEYK